MEDGDEDDSSSPDIVAHRGYSRPKIINHDNNNDDLSDYINFRLGLARVLALKKYREKYSQA